MFQEMVLCKHSGRVAGHSLSCISSSGELINCNSTSLYAPFRCCQTQRAGKWGVGGWWGKYCRYQQWSTLKNLESSTLVLGTFWGHKTQSSQATPVLHYPPFQGKDIPVPGTNQRYKHSVNLTRNQRQQKAECKQNQLQVPTTSMNSLMLFFDPSGKREKITHSLQIQLGHEGITKLQCMLCVKITALIIQIIENNIKIPRIF